jgi:hypothetical protein
VFQQSYLYSGQKPLRIFDRSGNKIISVNFFVTKKAYKQNADITHYFQFQISSVLELRLESDCFITLQDQKQPQQLSRYNVQAIGSTIGIKFSAGE